MDDAVVRWRFGRGGRRIEGCEFVRCGTSDAGLAIMEALLLFSALGGVFCGGQHDGGVALGIPGRDRGVVLFLNTSITYLVRDMRGVMRALLLSVKVASTNHERKYVRRCSVYMNDLPLCSRRSVVRDITRTC
jgi:hypothetical protein